jgi:glycosyltransferase involved in cell wall biosynthesis
MKKINTHPLVTIITSTLNAEKDIIKTINSIKNQNYKNIEYIIIDGGSKDSTVEIIKQNLDVVTYYITEIDHGVYDAWNKGLRISNGDYISFLGSGDVYLDDGLANLVDMAISNPKADLISSKIEIYNDISKYLKIYGEPWAWCKFKRYMTIAHPGALHSSRLFKKGGYFDESFKISGDYEFLLRFKDSLDSAFVNLVTARMLSGGLSQQGFRVFYESEIAKRKNDAVSPYIAKFDKYLAILKRAVRLLLSS